MKKLTYIISLLVFLTMGMWQKTIAQNTLTLSSLSPASGPYTCGTLVQLQYVLNYTMHSGTQTEIKISFDNTMLSLVTVNNQTGFAGPALVPGTASDYTFTSSPVSPMDNNLQTLVTFTVTFRVINTTCNATSATFINSSAYTLPSSGIPTDIISANKSITVNCNSSGASVSMDLIWGSACGIGIYEVNSMGYDSPNSNFSLTVPNGVTIIDVLNSSGNPVSPGATNTGNVWTWNRSGNAADVTQRHYVIVFVDKVVVCSQNHGNPSLDLVFNTHTICSPNNISTPAISQQLDCCRPDTPGCTTCPPPGGVGSDTSVALPGGGLYFTKYLVQTPFRYLPFRDNCRTHDYYLQIDNISPNDLDNFKLRDYISSISAVTPNAIEVTAVNTILSQLPFQPTATFNCEISPDASGISSLAATINPAVTINYSPGILPGVVADLTINNQANFLFPKFSRLIVKITHKLNDPHAALEPVWQYINTAKLNFSVANTGHNLQVQFKSKPDSYDPLISLEKYVRNNTTGTGYSAEVAASPNDEVEFFIRIRNYGMTPITNVNFIDVITNANNNLFDINPADLTVSGTSDYTATDLSAIETILRNSINSAGFGNPNISTINAAACLNGSEIIITYKVKVKPPSVIYCNDTYVNTTEIDWVYNGQQFGLIKHAKVKIDLFEHIAYGLEASCNGVDWVTGQINSLPGETIYYRATIKNNNTFPVNNLKIMLQVPHTAGYLSTHTFTPNVTTLTSSFPPVIGFPAGSANLNYNSLSPSASIGPLNYELSPTNDWLTTNINPAVPLTAPNNVFYNSIGSLAAGAYAYVTYSVATPYIPFGNSYVTDMGISLSSQNGCPWVVRQNLTQTIAQQDNCGNKISNCDIIYYASKIGDAGVSGPDHVYTVTLSNIIDLNGTGSFPDISLTEIVVHQPYKACPTLPLPFNKPMAPFTLSNLILSAGLTAYPSFAGSQRERATAIFGFSTTPGMVTFDIKIPQSFISLSPGCPIVFPVNIVFRDNSASPCPTICEKTIYLRL